MLIIRDSKTYKAQAPEPENDNNLQDPNEYNCSKEYTMPFYIGRFRKTL